MEFDKIGMVITQLEDGRWNMIATGFKKVEEEMEERHDLGSVTSRDKSTLIDWFIEKVEEA